MSDHKPVTAEELAAAERCAKSLLSIFPYHAEHAGFGGVSRDFHALAVTATERAAELLPRLARDLATARASIRNLIESLNEAQTDRDAIANRCLDLGRELEALRAAVRRHLAADTLAEAEPAWRALEALLPEVKP